MILAFGIIRLERPGDAIGKPWILEIPGMRRVPVCRRLVGRVFRGIIERLVGVGALGRGTWTFRLRGQDRAQRRPGWIFKRTPEFVRFPREST
jgi:hypothetical protein